MTSREKRFLLSQGHTRDEVEAMSRARGEARNQAMLDMIAAHRERMVNRAVAPTSRRSRAAWASLAIPLMLAAGVDHDR